MGLADQNITLLKTLDKKEISPFSESILVTDLQNLGKPDFNRVIKNYLGGESEFLDQYLALICFVKYFTVHYLTYDPLQLFSNSQLFSFFTEFIK